MKRFWLIVLTVAALLLALPACHKPEVEMTNGFVADTVAALTNRWYIVDYPFYQDCDRGSYVELNPQNQCHAYIQCNGEPHMDGTWEWNGEELFINCEIIAGLKGVSPHGRIKTLDSQSLQMIITVPFLGDCTVKLSRVNPVTGEVYD